jgi:hypothetical protein
MWSRPTPSTPGLDPTEILIPAGAGLGLIGAIELYRYVSAHGIAFREVNFWIVPESEYV